jgi:hypothetical protein
VSDRHPPLPGRDRPRSLARRLVAATFDGNFPLGIIQTWGDAVDEWREERRSKNDDLPSTPS